MRQFMNHAGFAIWHKDLQDKIEDTKKEWLTAETPEAAEKVRNRAVQLNAALDLIKRKVIEGDNARKMLDIAHEEEQDLQQQNQGLQTE